MFNEQRNGFGVQPIEVEQYFEQDGAYHFARWARPICPVVFGIEDQSLGVMKGAIEAVVALAGLELGETDPELGANMMVFFCRDWDELRDVRDLGALIPELEALVPRLAAAQAHQYRLFRYDEAGAIRACFVFLRMAGAFAELPQDVIALDLAVRSILLWGDLAFAERAPVEAGPDGVTLRPQIASLVRAAYDPVLPNVAHDRSHALRVFARMEAVQ